MRVLLTTESFLPYLSGVTVAVDALARGLRAAGHEVLVLAPWPGDGHDPEGAGSPGPAPAYAWLPSYQLPRVVPPLYRMPLPAPWHPALRAARDFAPEVVHAHSPFISGLLAARLARQSRAPLVFTHHTRFADYGHYAGPLAVPVAAATSAYLRRFWARSAAVIAPSSDLAAEIAARLPPAQRARVHVVPTGVDVEAIRSLAPVDPRPAQGWPPHDFVAVSMGRLAPEKSPHEILDAVALAAAEDPRIRLLLIGGGPSEPEMRRRAAARDLAGRVAFTGRLPRTDALARLRGGDLFVFASRTETQGLVLAEALAAGLPAVAIEGPGVRDSVRDAVDGIVVPGAPAKTRPLRLAAAILAIAADLPRRDEMAARAAADAVRFEVRKRVGEMEAVYRSVTR